MIDIHGLSLHDLPGSARIEVRRSVNRSIAAGQSVALTGPAGSGHTSLRRSELKRAAGDRIRGHGTETGTPDAHGRADLRSCLSALDTMAQPLPMAGRRDAPARTRLSPVLLPRSGG